MSDVAPAGQSVMLGGGFYSHNSRPQRAAATAADAHLVAAVEALPLPASPTPVLIGDFGCAGGANEMAPLAAAVDAIRERDARLPIEVAHTDLPQNDFAPLFALLQGPESYLAGTSAVYPYVVGRTLYGPLFPDRRLHLGWSAITLHWLSSMPLTVPGRVYSNLMEEGPARQSIAERSAADWRAFLTERARELVDGGELVLTGGASFPDGRSGAEGLFVMIQDVLAGLVDDGILRSGESDRIYYPTWNRTPAEWAEPVAELGFDLLAQEFTGTDDAENYRASLERGTFADDYLPFVRAITERPFFRWLDGDRTIDDRARVTEAFYERLHGRIAADPAAAACYWHVVTLRLRRRPR
jgi:hypothetical protein